MMRGVPRLALDGMHQVRISGETIHIALSPALDKRAVIPKAVND